jgi:L-threonylcarbamoyladenylate synthase
VRFFALPAALAAQPELGVRTRGALERLLPGALTLLLPNPRGRFALACGGDPSTLGVRVPDVPALSGVSLAVLQSSANRSGGADARRLADVPEQIRAGAGLVLDGGELPGTPSTVLDLREFEETGLWEVRRVGLVAPGAIASVIGSRM